MHSTTLHTHRRKNSPLLLPSLFEYKTLFKSVHTNVIILWRKEPRRNWDAGSNVNKIMKLQRRRKKRKKTGFSKARHCFLPDHITSHELRRGKFDSYQSVSIFWCSIMRTRIFRLLAPNKSYDFFHLSFATPSIACFRKLLIVFFKHRYYFNLFQLLPSTSLHPPLI